MVEVSTSILSVEKEKAVQVFYNLEVAKTDYYHIDVMDGKFVKRNTSEQMYEYATIIKHITTLPLDVHLMVENVEEYIEKYIDLHPNIITFHYEANTDKNIILSRIQKIKNSGIKVGISIKPNTDISEISEYLQYIHLVLIMTVEPGEGGQELIPLTIQKIKELKKYIQENLMDIDIEADGGINTENIDQLKDAGVNIVVAGKAILCSENYKETISKLK